MVGKKVVDQDHAKVADQFLLCSRTQEDNPKAKIGVRIVLENVTEDIEVAEGGMGMIGYF